MIVHAYDSEDVASGGQSSKVSAGVEILTSSLGCHLEHQASFQLRSQSRSARSTTPTCSGPSQVTHRDLPLLLSQPSKFNSNTKMK